MARVPLAPERDPVRDLEAIRERAATVLERAHHFVLENGDALARLRGEVMLRIQPAAVALDAIAAEQREDGSFPGLTASSLSAFGLVPAADSDSPVVGSLASLALLCDLEGLHHSCVERSVAYLSAAQREDGSWQSRPDQSAEARLLLTAMLAGYLGRTVVVRPRVLDRAAEFVGTRWAPERVEGGNWPGLASFAHFFTNVAHETSDAALQWCGRELERGFRTRRYGSLACLRVLSYCQAQALPAFGVGPPELAEALIDEQDSDGGYSAAAAGEGAVRVAPTVDAMQALIRLCASF